MSFRHSQWIVPTALALAVTTAWAGEIRLYERPEFRGPSVVTSSPLDTVARQGLGDSASSVVVADGRWEVCTREFFHGRCTELQPGSYPALSASLNGRIASVREIGYSQPVPATGYSQPPVTGYSQPPVTYSQPPVTAYSQPVPVTVAPSPPVVITEPPPVYSRPQVVPMTVARAYLYEDPNFAGAWVTMDRGEANDLDWAHFQNPAHRATSVRVEAGNWLFCTDMAFQGNCRIFGPGEYANLGGDMAPGIASARPVATPQYGAATVYRRQ
jgi:hypothetical protein